jgi:hypothetical protein
LLESKQKDLEIRRTGLLEAQTPHPETFQINFGVKNWDWRLCQKGRICTALVLT